MIDLLMTLAWLCSLLICGSASLRLALRGALWIGAAAERARYRRRGAGVLHVGQLRPLLS
ncbi:MAG TPA: hypothetical protein VGL58_12575 [Caulobacteraceae bacterium]